MDIEKNTKMIFECYRRMYKRAEPSVDFDELYSQGITKQPEFFMNYYLENDIIESICEDVAKEFKLKNWMLQKLKNTVFLGCSPNSCRETWEERRKTMKKNHKGFRKF